MRKIKEGEKGMEEYKKSTYFINVEKEDLSEYNANKMSPMFFGGMCASIALLIVLGPLVSLL